ncbi:hypothetical protein [uncultured Ilumatobacter sp.]|uniref:hypothetical protein n=1 Tax=uncultured Ilumatobacter sp. TaxID=879968 RepID=UPI00374E5D37
MPQNGAVTDISMSTCQPPLVEFFGIDAIHQAKLDNVDRDLWVVDGRGRFPCAVDTERPGARNGLDVRSSNEPEIDRILPTQTSHFTGAGRDRGGRPERLQQRHPVTCWKGNRLTGRHDRGIDRPGQREAFGLADADCLIRHHRVRAAG